MHVLQLCGDDEGDAEAPHHGRAPEGEGLCVRALRARVRQRAHAGEA